MRGLKAPGHTLSSSQESKNSGILEEIELLKEVKDILDELNIINKVISDQSSTLRAAFIRFERHDLDINGIIDYYRTFSKEGAIRQKILKMMDDAKKTQENVSRQFCVEAPN